MTTHKEKIEIEVDVPDGKRIVRYGRPGENDLVMNRNGIVFKPNRDSRDSNYWIVETVCEPYVFPEWMPEGKYLRETQSFPGTFAVTDEATSPIRSENLIPDWIIWTKPTLGRCVFSPLLVTHKK